MLRFVIGNINGKALGLNANEMCVLETIGKCSRKEDAKGWFASMQALADSMPFVISKPTVLRAVDKLLELGLIIRREDKSLFMVQNEPRLVQNEPLSVQIETSLVQNEPISAPLNNPPINKRTTNEKEETQTRAQERNEETIFIMENNFNNFWTAFHPSKEMNSRKAQCRWLWEDVIEYSVKQQIMNELYQHEAAGTRTPERNPFFYLRAFAPKVPHNWNGDHSIDRETTARLICAKFNGQYGAYTPEHVLLFKLEVSPDYQAKWEAYLKYVMSDPNKKPIKYS